MIDPKLHGFVIQNLIEIDYKKRIKNGTSK